MKKHGVNPQRLARIRRKIPGYVLGEMTNFLMDPAYRAPLGIGDLGEGFRVPIHGDVKTLFLSGTLDSNTPPYQAEQVRWGFTRGTHLRVENAGHEDILPHPGAAQAIVDFLAGKDVADRSLMLPVPRFVAID